MGAGGGGAGRTGAVDVVGLGVEAVSRWVALWLLKH